MQITHSTFPHLKIQWIDVVPVVTQEQIHAPLFSALACGLWSLVGDEARRKLSYLQEQGLLWEVSETCLDMLLHRFPQTFVCFLIKHLVGFLCLRKGHEHIQSSKLNAEIYFPSMFYRHC